MDPREFAAKLEKLAEIAQNADARSGDSRCLDKPNDSHPLIIIKMYPQQHHCKRCGEMKSEAPIRELLKAPGGWLEKCLGCRMIYDPTTNTRRPMRRRPGVSGQT